MRPQTSDYSPRQGVRRLTLTALRITAVGLLSLPAPALLAQEGTDDTEAWDVTAPRGETREIEFTTSEGTWMSVDVSADGAWVVFDLLGHVYRVPAAGGEATSLTQGSGVAVNFHPRFSPDGSTIAFIPTGADRPISG